MNGAYPVKEVAVARRFWNPSNTDWLFSHQETVLQHKQH